jgi:transposase
MVQNIFRRMIRIMRQILRKMGVPLYLHPRSKHTFSVHQHVIMLVLGQYCSTSYESFVQWLQASSDVASWLGLKTVPHFTTLHKAAARIGANLLHVMVGRFGCGRIRVAGMDASGFEDRHCTPYYTYRARLCRTYAKLSCIFDLQSQIVLCCVVSHRPIHDTKHVRMLIQRLACKPKTVVADAGYDAEWVHQIMRHYGIHSVIPVRGDHLVCRTRGRYRKQMRRCFDHTVYNQRSICETVFSVIKRMFGSEIRSHHDITKEKELLLRVIAYNCYRTTRLSCVVLWMISRWLLNRIF